MKRSENVGLVVMGGAAFAATFAAGMAYFAWQKPGNAAQPQTVASTQNCTTRPDGTQICQRTQRGFMYFLLPSWGSGGTSTAQARPAQSAALTSSARASTPAVNSGATRGGFGTTAKSTSFRPSAGG